MKLSASPVNWQQRAEEADLSIRHFIGGEYRACSGGKPIVKLSPRDGSPLYEFFEGDGTEVERAVTGARKAFDNGRWRKQPLHQRKAVLHILANLIEQHKDTFALYECLDSGKPITHAFNQDIAHAVNALRASAEGADKLLSPAGSDGASFTYQQRKPIGVVGGIIGWNYPLALAAQKVGPALAMGNSLVLKPSEFTALSASLLAALAVEAGVPSGVFNVVQGAGKTVGAKLAQHPDINLLTFVGSSATGKQLMVAAGQSNMKRLILECGGKSPYLVFDDCDDDLDALAANIVATAFSNQGALCVAGTRLLIQDTMKETLLPKILEQTARITPKDPLDPDCAFGALINEAHMGKVLGFIDSGEQEGAKRLCVGRRVLQETGGYYIEPTIFDQVNPQQKIAQEEIFGPVLCVFSFSDEAEAIQLANNTCYGLAAYAATTNLGRAQRLGQQLNAGSITIFSTATPTGGGVNIGMEAQCESGFGFEGGGDGLAAYTVSSTVNIFT